MAGKDLTVFQMDRQNGHEANCCNQLRVFHLLISANDVNETVFVNIVEAIA